MFRMLVLQSLYNLSDKQVEYQVRDRLSFTRFLRLSNNKIVIVRGALQRVHQLVVKLHAQGLVKFGDPERILEVVSRTKDKTVLLSHDEVRVLSAIPDAYATNVTKIRLAVLLPEKSVQHILDRFVARHFVAAQDGFTDNTIYQMTAAGLKHPQRHQVARLAHAPRLPVESDRVHAVLSANLSLHQ
jgi:DNA-binding MarR family transcriptional regulator